MGDTYYGRRQETGGGRTEFQSGRATMEKISKIKHDYGRWSYSRVFRVFRGTPGVRGQPPAPCPLWFNLPRCFRGTLASPGRAGNAAVMGLRARIYSNSHGDEGSTQPRLREV